MTFFTPDHKVLGMLPADGWRIGYIDHGENGKPGTGEIFGIAPLIGFVVMQRFTVDREKFFFVIEPLTIEGAAMAQSYLLVAPSGLVVLPEESEFETIDACRKYLTEKYNERQPTEID